MGTTPTAVFAHLNPLRIVPLVFIRLIVTSLATFASKRYADSDVSTSHFE
jgi:hypothetical protein